MVVMMNLFQYAIIHINKTAPYFYAPLLKGWIVAFIPSPWHMGWEGKGERWRLGGVGRVGGVGGMRGVGEVGGGGGGVAFFLGQVFYARNVRQRQRQKRFRDDL